MKLLLYTMLVLSITALVATLLLLERALPAELVTVRKLTPEHARLLRAIGEKETGHTSDPCPVGRASEFGKYQIQITTMRYQLKWKGTNTEIIALLCNNYLAEWAGDAILRDCAKRGYAGKNKLLYCWNGGPHSQYGVDPSVMGYINDVNKHYYRVNRY